tara:strand:- start:956 stop:1213 length:258 start_codon:yes stop_codon:yes gene_type:complete
MSAGVDDAPTTVAMSIATPTLFTNPKTERKDMFDSLLKATVGLIKLPIDIAADVVTLGGAINETNEPYTSKGIKQIMSNLDNATK